MSAARLSLISDKNDAIKEKRLVFISGSNEDWWWRDRLKTKMDHYPDIEWWDDLRVPFGNLDKRDDAIRRASVAVILVSPPYLSSETAIIELNILKTRAEAEKTPRLFPIIIDNISWQQWPKNIALRDLRFWSGAKVVGNLQEQELESELEEIARSIRNVAWEKVSFERQTERSEPQSKNAEPEGELNDLKEQPSSEFRVSRTARDLLRRAWELAEQSGRPAITSSCLLFAFGYRPKPESPTVEFVHDLLHSKSSYQTAFTLFLNEGRESRPTVAEEPFRSWKLSLNAQSILAFAASIALRTSSTPQIHTRHLFGAILAAPAAGRSQSARIRLQSMGFTEIFVRREFRQHLSVSTSQNELTEWDSILGLTDQEHVEPQSQQEHPEVGLATIDQPDELKAPEETSLVQEPAPPAVGAFGYQRDYPNYAPDRPPYNNSNIDAPLEDALGVSIHAGHLAQLIAAKDTFMPLSIGLFGSWGAGKSYFMELLDEQLRNLMKQPGQVFHQQIVQIKFNAWHYLDTNLWANLVSEIFDQLFAKLDEREDTTAQQVETLKKQLANQSALADEARAALATAETARKDAEEKLRLAMQARKVEENNLKNLLDDLKNLAIDKDVKAKLKAVADGLGWPKLESSYAELETRAEEVQSLAGRTRALALSVFTGPGSWQRAILLAAAMVLPLIVAVLAAYGEPWVKAVLAGSGKTIAQVVLALGALSTWLAAKIKAGNKLITKLESSYDEVKRVRAERESKDDAAKAQKKLAAKQQDEEQARHTLQQAEEKMKLIRAELTEMAPGRQLIRFLKQRASAEDYRRHLGLVSLVRRDFEQLSKLLMQTGKASDPQLPKIDRIVLYIDDLDRCRADRVVEVLEAVHLLLAFPLFAVVVAVDPRWLRQSLLDHYPRLLGGADRDASAQRERKLGMPATPQDYLEKIFQVPFQLDAMEKSGFEAMVRDLFPIRQTLSTLEISSSDQVETISDPVALLPTTGEFTTDDEAPLDQSAPREEVESEPEFVPEEETPAAPDPQRLTLTQKEVEDVQRFQLFFTTPRALKRFANTYSLIRVGVSEEEWTTYLGVHDEPGTYRVPLLMLAVTSAFPVLARPWLLWLKETPTAEWQLSEQNTAMLANRYSDTTHRAEWDRLSSCLGRLSLDDWTLPEQELLMKWVPRVARYSF